MNMRVSTQQLYSGGTSGIQRLQGDLYTLQNQVSTGRRIVTPQDDPVGAAQALVVSQSSAVNQLYIKNQGIADTKLSALDETLAGIGEELQSIYEKSIAGGNGSYSISERTAIATELDERLAALITLSNTQDGTGRYVFGGFDSTTAPFGTTGNPPSPFYNAPGFSYVDYHGDQGEQRLQVSASLNLSTSVPGSDVFINVKDANGNAIASTVFDAVKNMADYLRGTGTANYTDTLGDLSASMENLSRIRASVGARLSSLQAMTNTAEDRALQYDTQLSNLQDLDYAKAITDITQKKTQLEAAQATFASTAKLSLFDYI